MHGIRVVIDNLVGHERAECIKFTDVDHLFD
jgi:hypothetical protein